MSSRAGLPREVLNFSKKGLFLVEEDLVVGGKCFQKFRSAWNLVHPLRYLAVGLLVFGVHGVQLGFFQAEREEESELELESLSWVELSEDP